MDQDSVRGGGGAQLTCESAEEGTAVWVKEKLAWVVERGNRTIKGNNGGS